jgi:hypothetical protein
MRTFGYKRYDRLAPSDCAALCGYCGAQFYRSELRRDGAGVLACHSDYGRDTVTLARLNAEDSASRRFIPTLWDGAQRDRSGYPWTAPAVPQVSVSDGLGGVSTGGETGLLPGFVVVDGAGFVVVDGSGFVVVG